MKASPEQKQAVALIAATSIMAVLAEAIADSADAHPEVQAYLKPYADRVDAMIKGFEAMAGGNPFDGIDLMKK